MIATVCTTALCVVLTGPFTNYDGDTFRSNGRSWRLFGVDAAELHQPGGREAKAALAGLLAGPMECIVISGSATRIVADCTLPDGRSLSCAMIGQPYVTEAPQFSGGAFRGCEE